MLEVSLKDLEQQSLVLSHCPQRLYQEQKVEICLRLHGRIHSPTDEHRRKPLFHQRPQPWVADLLNECSGFRQAGQSDRLICVCH